MAVILKLRRLYGYEAVHNFDEAVIPRHEAVILGHDVVILV